MLNERNFEISVDVSTARQWPNGKPIQSEDMGNGKTKHVFEDKRAITVSEPDYRLEYLSTWVDAAPDETYDVNIAIVGLSKARGFFEVWNFDICELRNYAFAKTKRIVHLVTGETFSGEEVRKQLESSRAGDRDPTASA